MASSGRRKFLKYGVAGAVAGVAAGVGGYAALTTYRKPPVKPPEEIKEKEPWRWGWIGAFDSDMGKSALRMTEMAIEDLNAQGGVLGRPVELIATDAKEDVEEAIKGYEYLAETVKVDIITSSDIDDNTMGWLPRLAEYRMPTLDSWTSAIRALDKVRDEYDKFKPYFMNQCNDYQHGVSMTLFAKLFMNETLGMTKCVLFHEDTTYAHGTAEFVEVELAPGAGIEIVDKIVYDIDTVDFSPLYSRCVASGADFIYIIASVRDLVPAAQYAELGVPIPLVGIIVASFSEEFWEDTGGRAAGITTYTPAVDPFGKMDDINTEITRRYRERWPSRPKTPHFNAYNCYHGVFIGAQAAEKAGGFSRPAPGQPVDESIVNAWIEEVENTDYITGYLEDGYPCDRFKFLGPGEIDPQTNYECTHGVYFDWDGVDGKCGVWHEWMPDGWCYAIWPERYALKEFWIPGTEYKQ